MTLFISNNLMKLIVPIILFILLLSSCRTATMESRFDDFQTDYLLNREELLPEIPLGEYPPSLALPNKERFEKAIRYFMKSENSLKDITRKNLSEDYQKDYDFLKSDIAKCTAHLSDSAYLWNPAFYNVGGILKQKLVFPKRNICSRIKSIDEDLSKVHEYYEIAKSNLKTPSIKKTLLAIEKNSLGFDFLKNEVMDSLEAHEGCKSLESWSDSLFLVNRDNSLIAIKDYVAFCNSLKFEYGEKKSAVVFRDSL